jgi:FkbM family methyltransferase
MPTDPDDLDLLPLAEDEQARIRMTLSCHDSDAIAKVPGAGEVHDGPGGRYQLMHNGVRIAEHCYGGPWTTELIRRLRGHHEPQEELVFHEVMQRAAPATTMVELGCFWSYYSLWFDRSVPDARLLLLEPVLEHLEAGRRNFALNEAAGTFVQALVGARSDSGTRMLGEDKVVRQIPTLSVDDLVREHGVERVELLLIDVQGAELDALKGAQDLIAGNGLRFVFVSTHHHLMSNDPLMHQKCVRFLEDRGAHIIARHNVIESFSGDGLVVASFDPADRDLSVPVSKNWPTNSMWPELEYDLDEAWRALGLNIASRRRIRRTVVDAVNRAPAVLPAIHSVVHQWDLLTRKRQERRRQ